MGDGIRGFGTHNGWLAFRGWLGVKIYGAPVKWTVHRRKGMFNWHVVEIG